MTKTKTMREMMVAASLIAASACGAVQAPMDDSTADGSAAGSAEEPVACEAASDCSPGVACDTNTHECVTDALAIEQADFVDDGLRLWSATSGPVLRGTYEGSSSAVVQVKVGSSAPVLASVDGSRWSVQLPSGTFTANDTLVSVTMTDPSRGVVSLERTFALDSTPPVIGLGTSKVRDEGGDLIDFSSGVPVHNHAGPEVDLGVGCPVVRKYSYLMDTHAPVYGTESTPNPITYAVTMTDTKLVGAEFRVRDEQGTVLRDWKSIAGTGAGYPVTLYRDGATGIGDLAMKAGKYTIDVRALDWGGLEANQSYCIDFQPLAAPLAFTQAATPTDADALPGWTLLGNSPISRLSYGTGAAVIEQQITQYSSEPVAIAVSAPSATGTWRVQYAQGWIASAYERVNIPCSSTNCAPGIAPTWSTTSGALTSYGTSVDVIDANGNTTTASNHAFVIPGRAAGAAAIQYRVRVRIGSITHFGASSLYVYGERTNGLLNYTGTPSNNTTSACASTDLLKQNCTKWATYQYIRGINTIGLTLNAMPLNLTVAPRSNGGYAAPAHVPASMFVAPAVNWDGGDENTL